MPRGKQKRTKTGEPAQSNRAFEGQGYGDGVAQEALQRTMPSVNRQAAGVPSAASAGSPQPTGGPVAPQPAPADIASMLQQAPVGLLAGTQLPGQPVTAGLSSGPGVGPEGLSNLRAQTPLRRTLEQLSRATGDPLFQQLLERARL